MLRHVVLTDEMVFDAIRLPQMTITRSILLRLRVPATATELAALTGAPIRTVRALLYQNRARGRCKRLDRGIKSIGKRGPYLEYLWVTA